MNSFELATRIQVEGECLRESQSRLEALYQQATDNGLLLMLDSASTGVKEAAEWAEKASRLALAIARFQQQKREADIDRQREPLIEQLRASIDQVSR